MQLRARQANRTNIQQRARKLQREILMILHERKELSWNFLDKAICAIPPTQGRKRMIAKAAIHAFRYDGVRSGTERKTAPPQVGPNTYVFQRDRIQLLREAIDLENNFSPAKMLNRIYAMFVAPVAYNAQTGDSKLDLVVEDYLGEWFENCDITGRHNFFQMMAFGIMGMNRGGDYGWWITREGIDDVMDIDDISDLPIRIMGVEADRIGGLYQTELSEDYIGGITINTATGKPEFYRVFERVIGAEQYVNPVDVPARDFVHLIDSMQGDMYRGVSKLDAACAQLRDLYEMVGYIKGKAKLASALTLFTNSIGSRLGNGAMDPYTTSEFVDAKGGQQQDIYLGQINHLPAGADMKFPDSDSPGPETQYLMKLLLQLTCMSYNLPYSFGIDASALGGVSARLESEQAKAEFERGQRLIDRQATRIKNLVLTDAASKGVIPLDRLLQACKGRFSHRPHPQPDIGKEASAAVSLYQTGLLNPIEHWTDNGQDPEKVAADMVKWAKVKANAIKGTPFTVEEIFGAGPAMPVSTSVSTTTDETQGNGDGTTKEFKYTPDEALRAKTISYLVDLLKVDLPIDQAIAAAYKIYDKGKTRQALINEVKEHLNHTKTND